MATLLLSHQESKGYEFESETDTETIPKLVKYMYDNRESDDISFATLVERVIQQLVSIGYRFLVCLLSFIGHLLLSLFGCFLHAGRRDF